MLVCWRYIPGLEVTVLVFLSRPPFPCSAARRSQCAGASVTSWACMRSSLRSMATTASSCPRPLRRASWVRGEPSLEDVSVETCPSSDGPDLCLQAWRRWRWGKRILHPLSLWRGEERLWRGREVFFLMFCVGILRMVLHWLSGWKLCICMWSPVRYLQRVVCHPSLLQDPDVREFLEREEVSDAYFRAKTSLGTGLHHLVHKSEIVLIVFSILNCRWDHLGEMCSVPPNSRSV